MPESDKPETAGDKAEISGNKADMVLTETMNKAEGSGNKVGGADAETSGNKADIANAAAGNRESKAKKYPAISAKCIYWGIFLAIAVLVIDQLTKAAAVYWLKGKPPFTVIPEVLDFRYAENPGAAWGMFAGHSWLLLIIAVVTMFLALRFIDAIAEGSICKAFAVFTAVGGIAGNAIDRIWHGYVIDFIAVDLQFYKWPIFNIADCAISVGACLYILVSLLYCCKKKEAADVNGTES